MNTLPSFNQFKGVLGVSHIPDCSRDVPAMNLGLGPLQPFAAGEGIKRAPFL